ncbi:MAG: N-acetyltransferase [Chloroflexi bacterium]|nr:N-acetyltransferase [Chloroflexota bacterium]
MRVRVRPATNDDLPRLTEIYNHYIVTTPATFDIEPFTVEQRREWFTHYDDTGHHRVLVAEAEGQVVGMTWSSAFRPKRAYETTVETSIYCAPEATGIGLGTTLYQALFAALADQGLHRAVAGITLPNDASVRLHERFGFRQLGVFSEVGRKFGRYWDVAWFEKRLPHPPEDR